MKRRTSFAIGIAIVGALIRPAIGIPEHFRHERPPEKSDPAEINILCPDAAFPAAPILRFSPNRKEATCD